MARILKNNDSLLPVAEYEVAPHRYTYDGKNNSDEYAKDFKTWLESVPYKKGEVIWLDIGEKDAVRARIITIGWEDNLYGDRVEKYKVHVPTKKGTWSKLWFYTHPGFVQRGYQKAGLAPDVPE
jgi:hypothetical protein